MTEYQYLLYTIFASLFPFKGIDLNDDDNNEEDNNKDDDNNKDNKNDKGISALGLDKDLGFSRGHQGHQEHQPHDGDDDEEEE